ncbi:MAG: hypothetical protein MUF42_00050 [Cytophagaceae bacterium]|jgi:hypothetical protein|nr:hypothetical protein [Cytophagaceae bacterium]
METIFTDLIKIILPSAISLYAIYLVVKTFLSKEFEKRVIDLRIKNNELVLPVRLQAYERMALYLERISLHNLVLRTNDPSFTAGEFQSKMTMDIREEFNHNVAQQIYVSDAAWALIKTSMEENIAIINKCGQKVPSDARSIELAKMVFEELLQRNEDPTSKAMRQLKEEIRQVF